VQRFPMLLVVVRRRVSDRTVAGIYLSECVPTGCEVVGCVAKASFSPSESLREATVTESSSVAREMALHDLPLNLGLLVFHCSSLMIPGWTHMISQDSVIIRMRLLAFCFSAIRLMTFNLALGTGTNPSWTVIFGKVPKLRVTCWR